MSKGVAIVTGCASGIGRAIAFRLASDGFDVALNDLPSRRSDLEQLAEQCRANGRRTHIVTGDVSDEDFVKNMIDQTIQVLGSLEVMIANAGIAVTKPLLETTVADFDKIIGVNVRGVFLCFKHAGRVMVAQGKGGRIVGASSTVGKQGSPLISVYSASKAAVRGLTQSAAGELGRYGITVNSYAPGVIDTEMVLESSKIMPQYVDQFSYTEMTEKQPIGRMGKPDDIAGWVSFIVGDDAKYITGQTVCINGGLYYD